MADQYFIVDLRTEFARKPYITFWRPENGGYAYPLAWAGRYGKAEVIDGGDYYTKREGRSHIRFAVPCAIVEQLAVAPAPGMIDGDAGPVVVNDAGKRKALRKARLHPLAEVEL